MTLYCIWVQYGHLVVYNYLHSIENTLSVCLEVMVPESWDVWVLSEATVHYALLCHIAGTCLYKHNYGEGIFG